MDYIQAKVFLSQPFDHRHTDKYFGLVREEPLMIWGELGEKREKKLNGYSPGKKKLNSTTLKKKNSIQQSVGWEKKNLREFSARGPPRSLMVRP